MDNIYSIILHAQENIISKYADNDEKLPTDENVLNKMLHDEINRLIDEQVEPIKLLDIYDFDIINKTELIKIYNEGSDYGDVEGGLISEIIELNDYFRKHPDVAKSRAIPTSCVHWYFKPKKEMLNTVKNNKMLVNLFEYDDVIPCVVLDWVEQTNTFKYHLFVINKED